MVGKDLGKSLIAKLEHRQVNLAMKAMLVKALFADSSTAVGSATMQESTELAELALTVKLKAEGPVSFAARRGIDAGGA